MHKFPYLLYYQNIDCQYIEEKKSALNDLGIMSLPYIKDSIDAGHTEFQDTYNSILEGTAVSSRTNDATCRFFHIVLRSNSISSMICTA